MNHQTIARLGASLLLCSALAAATPAAAAGPARHRSAPALSRSTADYSLPDVTVTRTDGTRVRFLREINDGRPVILNFVFTSCSTVCPVQVQTFAAVQARLGNEAGRVHMVSISMDPEEDTPPRLREYAKRQGAGPQWQFYTGTYDTSIALQKAFGAWRGDKMSHAPLTFIRRAPGEPWVRLEGFPTPDDILHEYQVTVATQ